MILRLLLVILGIQKIIDALSLHPPVAEAVLRWFGFEDLVFDDPLHLLLSRLWGAASLAWAYLLIAASRDPKSKRTIIEGSAIGFAAVGLVASSMSSPWAGIVGLGLILEAGLLGIARWWLWHCEEVEGSTYALEDGVRQEPPQQAK